MKSNDIIREAMKESSFTRALLAEKIDKQPTAVSNMLSRKNGMRIDNFIQMMNAMGYDVIVRRGKEEMEVTE